LEKKSQLPHVSVDKENVGILSGGNPMSIAQLSPKSVAANPAYVNPQVRSDQTVSAPQVSQEVQRSVLASKTDTVTISQQALKMLASDGDTQAKEATESGAEKATETFRGKA
jgi:hypothetical protein